MWVYQPITFRGTTRYSVGFFDPDGRFVEVAVFEDQEDAEARVHYLNGGG